jgi:uncharacterized protein
MKKLISTLILSVFFLTCFFNRMLFSSEPLFPNAPDGYIYDGARLLQESDKVKLTKLFAILQNKTSAQVGIVTVESTQPEPIESYAVELFQRWGIGQKGKNNGVLLLVARDDKSLRIEVGYGLEGAIPDILCKNIISNIIVPRFKAADYSGGILKGATAIVSLIAKEYNVAITGEESSVLDQVGSSSKDQELVWIILFFVLVIIILIFMSGGSSGGGYRGGGYWYGGSTGGFGGGFGGGSSGGFGGFGGGISGGGGASGRW